jgi:leucyl aminopeptidase
MKLHSIASLDQQKTIVYITNPSTNWSALQLTPAEAAYARQQIDSKNYRIVLNRYEQFIVVLYFEKQTQAYRTHEQCRTAGADVASICNQQKITKIAVANESDEAEAAIHVAEGLFLATYQFLKYRQDADKVRNSLTDIAILEDAATAAEVNELQHVLDAVCVARELINEPLSYLTAEQLGKEFETLGKKGKFKVTVWGKSKIEKEKMGGLLAVNRGSKTPPSFTIMEWKPKKAVNSQPIVLIGKGVVYDTGGLSLKPTANSMDFMKCDMSGAAAVGAAIYAVAKNDLPVHVIGLVPATDNRPGEDAYVPGDIIQMHNNTTVEVLNTDAEGRMILADALSYAQQYKPELVIDVATLTGAVVVALGHQGIGLMSNMESNNAQKQLLIDTSYQTYERCHELPMWDEYKDLMKSDIADLKNIGAAGQAGTITAAKFLECFTNYPWIHLDIAGNAWNASANSYHTKGGDGMAVRLFYQFLKQRSQQA